MWKTLNSLKTERKGILPFQSELGSLTNLYRQNVDGCDEANTEGRTITGQTRVYSGAWLGYLTTPKISPSADRVSHTQAKHQKWRENLAKQLSLKTQLSTAKNIKELPSILLCSFLFFFSREQYRVQYREQ